jgi:hypothetical protein
VDYDSNGHPLGVEITAPDAVALGRLNQLLSDLGELPLGEQEYRPLRAAQTSCLIRQTAFTAVSIPLPIDHTEGPP